MKKILTAIVLLSSVSFVCAFDYVPKNSDSNPFGNSNGKTVLNNQKLEQASQPEMREIKTLAEYFRYLPAEVHRHWTPYKANINYEVTVQFIVHRDGTISNVRIIGTNCPNANQSVLNAVKSGAPYQPLPVSYSKDSVKAQVVLEYHKQ